jgi:hypothetical protein
VNITSRIRVDLLSRNVNGINFFTHARRGGSSYTPETINSLLTRTESLPLKEQWLVL